MYACLNIAELMVQICLFLCKFLVDIVQKLFMNIIIVRALGNNTMLGILKQSK